MQRGLIAGVVVMLIGIAFFLFSGRSSSPRPVQVATPPIAEIAQIAPVVASVVNVAPVAPVEPKKEVFREEEAPPLGKLDPKSDAFIELVDEIIPRRLYGRVADRCYQRNYPDWEKIKLSIKERAVGGQYMITDVSIIESNIQSNEMRDCIVSAVKGASWGADEMPDWEDEDELFIRVSGMKKYLDLPDENDP